jgi:crotonobetainyl-CoA:carnitine CoA-transferase CaiB-like acyl-CoA transferase
LLDFDHFRERGFYLRAEGPMSHPASPVILNGQRLSGADDAPLAQWCGLDVPDNVKPEADAGPLTGIRVLDLSAFWAGPGCGVLLGNLGATVIKVEGVTRPDGMRQSAARGRKIAHWWEYSGIYHGANAGKQAISLELSSPEGREVLLRLAEGADVVVENYSATVMDRFRLTYDALRDRNPGIVMVRMPAFGLTGPWSNRRGYATTMDQISGISWATGERDGPPVGAKAFGDFNGSLHAAFATLLALARRRATGEGAQVEVALAEACLSVTADQVIEYSSAGHLVQRVGSRRRDAAPQGIFQAGDGKWIAVSVPTDAAWAAFVGEFNPGLPGEPGEFASLPGRLASPDALEAALDKVVSGAGSQVIVSRLRKTGVAAEVVTSPSFVDEDPDLLAAEFFRSLPHPLHGPMNHITLPFTIDGRRLGPASSAPLYAQDNERLLAETLGFGRPEIDALRAAGAISDTPGFS